MKFMTTMNASLCEDVERGNLFEVLLVEQRHPYTTTPIQVVV